VVQSHPGQIVCETLSQKYPSQERAGGVALSSSPSTTKKKKKKKEWFYFSVLINMK
jgi:hypothetical protein